jgi:hypothetical protein
MYAPTAYRIRVANAKDAETLERLAERAGRKPLAGRALIAHVGWEPAAALSLSDGRVIADPAYRSDHLIATLRIQARAMRAYETTPSLRERLVAAFADYRGATVTPVPHWRDAGREQERRTGSDEASERKAA